MFDFIEDIEQAEKSIGADYKERMAAMAYALSLAQQALEMIEEYSSGKQLYSCIWCLRPKNHPHADHCLRQRALEAIKKVEEME